MKILSSSRAKRATRWLITLGLLLVAVLAAVCLSSRARPWQASTGGPKPARSAKLLADLGTIRAESANQFRQLADEHQTNAQARLARVVQASMNQGRSRAENYADWLLSYEATCVLAKAWWNNSLESEIARSSQERLLSEKEIADPLQQEAARLQAELGARADVISSNHRDRVARVLARFDNPAVPAGIKLTGLSLPPEGLTSPALVANAGGLSAFIGSMFAGNYAEKRFVTWLGKKVALKAGSKVVRVGTGPVGWVAGFTVGWAAEWAADTYFFKPQLIAELNGQLQTLETQLLSPSGPAAQIAEAQAEQARSAAAELSKPVEMAVAKSEGPQR